MRDISFNPKHLVIHFYQKKTTPAVLRETSEETSSLDGSISLLHLYPGQMTSLYTTTAVDLHQSFLWLRPTHT